MSWVKRGLSGITSEEDISCVGMGSHTLKKGESVTYPIGCVGSQFWRI